MITINSARFQQVRIDQDKIIVIPQGIIGFPLTKKYIMLDQIENTPFIWLHAVDTPSLCFIIADPHTFMSSYNVELDNATIEELDVKDKDSLLTMVIITIPEKTLEVTANLKGPLVINPENRQAKQVVLTDDKYSTKHKIC